MRRPDYKFLIRWAIIVVIFVFLGEMAWKNWIQVREASFTFRIFPLILSSLILAFSYFIQVWAWYLITLKLRIAIPFKETLESWFYSQLGKYLPGKVWLFLSRFYLYESKGKSKGAVTVALYFETMTMIMAAGLIFLVSFLFCGEAPSSCHETLYPWIILGLILASLSLHPKVLQKILNRILTFLKRDLISFSISYSDVLRILGVCILSWAFVGLGFSLFVNSAFSVSLSSILFLTGALAISSTLGLVALFAPSGLGVREGVLVFLLSSIMPSAVAVILSVLTRLWMTFIEIGLVGMVYLTNKLNRKKKESEHA